MSKKERSGSSAIVSIVREREDTLATKQDMFALKQDIVALKQDMIRGFNSMRWLITIGLGAMAVLISVITIVLSL